MSSLGKGYKMHLKVVWNRVGVANFQRHTPTQKYSECPPPPGVVDCLGAINDLPLYFVLVHQGQNGVIVRLPHENLQPHGEVMFQL